MRAARLETERPATVAENDRKGAFLVRAKDATLESKEEFCELVAEGLYLTALTLREVAEALETAPGTVSRWQNGHTAPARFMRRPVIEFFRRRVSRLP